MGVWVVVSKHNDHDFIHVVTSVHNSQRKAIESIRATPVYQGLSDGGKIDVDTDLLSEGVAGIDDYTFIITYNEVL